MHARAYRKMFIHCILLVVLYSEMKYLCVALYVKPCFCTLLLKDRSNLRSGRIISLYCYLIITSRYSVTRLSCSEVPVNFTDVLCYSSLISLSVYQLVVFYWGEIFSPMPSPSHFIWTLDQLSCRQSTAHVGLRFQSFTVSLFGITATLYQKIFWRDTGALK